MNTAPPRSARRVIATVLVVLGLVLVPVGVVTSSARTLLTDADAFVDTLAPLAEDPAVQEVVTDGVTGALTGAIDALGLPSIATQALRPLVEDQVGAAVSSDAFARAWQQSLRLTHAQLVATLSDDPGSALTLTDAGGIELQIGPIVAEVRERLVANGAPFVERIPDIDRGVLLYENGDLAKLAPVYGLVMTLGAWTPWLAAALLVAGVIVAVRRPRAVVGTGIALAVIGLALCAVLAIARGRVVSAIDGTIVTPEAARVAYDALAPWILWPAIAITAVGVVAVAAAVVGRRIRRPR
jgi:hypothetical protein